MEPVKFPNPAAAANVHAIQLRLREVSQLFNSLDPSPFNEQDLDHDAEEFIVGWARELPRNRPFRLVVHLDKPLRAGEDQKSVGDAIRHYFGYRAEIGVLDLRQLLKQGRLSLIIGMAFLVGCLLLAKAVPSQNPNTGWSIVREGLTIVGWVAMWRPMEIYLYDWWPLWRRIALFRRLERMKVDLHLP